MDLYCWINKSTIGYLFTLFTYLLTHLVIYLLIYLFITYQFTFSFIYLFVYLFNWLFVFTFIYIYLFNYLFIDSIIYILIYFFIFSKQLKPEGINETTIFDWLSFGLSQSLCKNINNCFLCEASITLHYSTSYN